MFAHLPVQIRNIITARENDRERALRRAQNSYAELKKLLRLQTAPDETKSVEVTNVKENENHG